MARVNHARPCSFLSICILFVLLSTAMCFRRLSSTDCTAKYLCYLAIILVLSSSIKIHLYKLPFTEFFKSLCYAVSCHDTD